ncbi:hypothetical protein H8356DRAFT_1668994 [Neocallimastix lanati (nom. inval.)]|nr:hypothetical protein H8356DRAFT_1668994 [Neocallimastix sp. JGI-2020a]
MENFFIHKKSYSSSSSSSHSNASLEDSSVNNSPFNSDNSSTIVRSKMTFDSKDKMLMLNAIQKLGAGNKNVKSWIKQITSWMKLFEETDMNDVVLCMKLASAGDIPEYIDEYVTQNPDNLSMEGLESFLLTEWLHEKKQSQLLSEIKNMSIERNETVVEFNKRFKEIYKKLNEESKKYISIYDYEGTLKPRTVVWSGVHSSCCSSLEEAYEKAELYDEIYHETNKRKNNNFRSLYQEGGDNRNRIVIKPKTLSPQVKGKSPKENDTMEDLTNKMKNLRIKTCYICEQEGHLKYDCPKLKRLNALLEKLDNLEEKN